MLPVPLPFRIPVRVVEPVPPCATESASVSEREPRLAVCAKRFVELAVGEKRFVGVAFGHVLLPVQVFAFARSVEEAAERVIESPLEKEVPFTVPSGPVMRLVPMEEVATTWPLLSTPSTAEARLVRKVLPETVSAVDEAYVALKFVAQPVVIVPRVVEALPKMLSPVNVLLFARSVEEAAVIVMSAEPLNDVPLMFLAVARTVAEPAVKLAPVPEMLVPTKAEGVPSQEAPEMLNWVVEALPKMLSPVNVLLFARSVEEAAVMVMSAEPLKEVPLMLRAVARTVAAPAVREAAVPEMLVPTSVDGVPSQEAPEMVRAVVEAPPFAEKRPLVMVEEALEMKPEVKVWSASQFVASVVLGMVVEAVIQ